MKVFGGKDVLETDFAAQNCNAKIFFLKFALEKEAV
jgi:hypothetical protein